MYMLLCKRARLSNVLQRDNGTADKLVTHTLP